MSLLHVLLAVALPLRLVIAGREFTMVDTRIGRMFVVDVAVPFFFGRPSDGVVFACFVRAFPGARVRLLVFALLD